MQHFWKGPNLSSSAFDSPCPWGWSRGVKETESVTGAIGLLFSFETRRICVTKKFIAVSMIHPHKEASSQPAKKKKKKKEKSSLSNSSHKRKKKRLKRNKREEA